MRAFEAKTAASSGRLVAQVQRQCAYQRRASISTRACCTLTWFALGLAVRPSVSLRTLVSRVSDGHDPVAAVTGRWPGGRGDQ